MMRGNESCGSESRRRSRCQINPGNDAIRHTLPAPRPRSRPPVTWLARRARRCRSAHACRPTPSPWAHHVRRRNGQSGGATHNNSTLPRPCVSSSRRLQCRVPVSCTVHGRRTGREPTKPIERVAFGQQSTGVPLGRRDVTCVCCDQRSARCQCRRRRRRASVRVGPQPVGPCCRRTQRRTDLLAGGRHPMGRVSRCRRRAVGRDTGRFLVCAACTWPCGPDPQVANGLRSIYRVVSTT